MNSSIRDQSAYRILTWIALTFCIFGIYYLVFIKNSISVPFGDSVNYWAAGKLMLNGDNPYLSENVLELRYQAGIFTEFPPNAIFQIMYPPWAMPFMLPLGLFDYPISSLFWLIFHIIIILVCANLVWKIYKGPKESKFILYLVTVAFAPTFIVLIMGHFTTLHLLGLVGFLFFLQDSKHKPWNDFAAGMSASLILIKPQLLYLFIIALLIWTIDKRNWMIIFGGTTFIVISSLISIVLNPIIFSQYLESFSSYTLGVWATPTLGTLLRVITLVFIGQDLEWLQIFPVIFGLSWFIFYYSKHHKSWDWAEELPLIILVSYVTSPYMWTYDMVVLLIPVIAVSIKLMRQPNNLTIWLFSTIFIIMNLVTVILHRFYDNFWFVWFAPTLLILYLIEKKRAQQDQIHSSLTTNK